MLFHLKKKLFIVIGTTSLVIGSIGIVIPILPTTPFMILTTICYMKGSNRLYHWIIRNRLFGKFLENYLQRKGISIRSKMISIIFLWITIAFSSFIFVNNVFVQYILLIVLLAVTVHILLLKTYHRRSDYNVINYK